MIEVKMTFADAPAMQAFFAGLGNTPLPAAANAPAPKQETAKTETPAATPGAASEEDVTIEMIRARVKLVSDAGKKDEFVALLKEANAANVSAVKEHQYLWFYKKLAELI